MYHLLFYNKKCKLSSLQHYIFIILCFPWVRNWAWLRWVFCFTVFHKTWIMICSFIWRVDGGRMHIHSQSLVLRRIEFLASGRLRSSDPHWFLASEFPQFLGMLASLIWQLPSSLCASKEPVESKVAIQIHNLEPTHGNDSLSMLHVVG